jgi:phospholipid/cholesterol/gamma-HCH transport system permease protein
MTQHNPDPKTHASKHPAKRQPERIGLMQLFRRWLADWWEIIHFGAQVLVLSLSPSTYSRSNRQSLAYHVYSSIWKVLPWFSVLCALISLVLIRIVVVTAASYGLSGYALEMVVRVLVLELIPLGAALFVVLGLGSVDGGRREHAALDRYVPGVLANAFAVTMLACVSSVVALVLAYLVVYGVSPWGFDDYTRMVGRVFDLTVMLVFSIKIILFGLAVAIIPVASARRDPPPTRFGSIPVPEGTVRLFLVLVMIEAASLAIKYI